MIQKGCFGFRTLFPQWCAHPHFLFKRVVIKRGKHVFKKARVTLKMCQDIKYPNVNENWLLQAYEHWTQAYGNELTPTVPCWRLMYLQENEVVSMLLQNPKCFHASGFIGYCACIYNALKYLIYRCSVASHIMVNLAKKMIKKECKFAEIIK